MLFLYEILKYLYIKYIKIDTNVEKYYLVQNKAKDTCINVNLNCDSNKIDLSCSPFITRKLLI